MIELNEGQLALQLVTHFECAPCHDTGLALCSDDSITICHCLAADMNQCFRNLLFFSAPKELSRTDSFPREFNCARAIGLATTKQPVRGTSLRMLMGGGEREAKDTNQTPGDDSLRVPPYGYYWISSPEEFLQWFNPMRSQALSELSTAYHLAKRYYPELCGQFKFKFEEGSNNG